MLGAGEGSNLSSRNYGDVGGAEAYQMSLSQMPEHVHKMPFTNDENTLNHSKGDTSKGEYRRVGGKIDTDPAGGKEPYSVMPPFIALTLCKKVM